MFATNRPRFGVLALFIGLTCLAQAGIAAEAAQPVLPAWIVESNRESQALLEIIARYSPESASSLGVEGHDSDVLDLKPGIVSRQKADVEAAISKLKAARDAAADP